VRPDAPSISTGGVEEEHPLQIPGHGHEAPLAAYVFEPAQRKLTESERGFDDAEHRFRRLFAQGVERSAFGRLQHARTLEGERARTAEQVILGADMGEARRPAFSTARPDAPSQTLSGRKCPEGR